MVAHGDRAAPSGQDLLAEFVKYGHQKPFEEIVRRYAGMVFNVCVRITKDKHEAEDATQAVFLTLALQAKRGTEIKALGPWLQQVAKRLSLDSRRSKKRRKTREERHQEEQTLRRESILGDTLPEPDLDELKTVLHEELQKLPTKYRLPLILHYFGGLTRDEMAAELNCKPSTLGVRIFRGREMLAGRLTGRGINISAGALAIALGYTVQRAISDALISSTSYAATALVAGHDGAGLASAHVIGLTRRASSALAIGKVKIAALTLMIAGTSLGASVKAMDMIPAIDVRQMISNQVQRIVRPLFAPFSQPMRVDAQPAVSAPAPTVATVTLTNSPVYLPPVEPPAVARTIAVAKPLVAASSGPLTIVTPASQQPAALRMPWMDSATNHSDDTGTPLASSTDDRSSTEPDSKSTDVTDASAGGAGGGGGGSGGGSAPTDLSGGHHSADLSSVHASPPSLPVPVAIASSNDLVVTPSLKTSKTTTSTKTTLGANSTSTVAMTATPSSAATDASDAASSSPSSATAATAATDAADASAMAAATAAAAASPVQVVQIPATNGSVSESDGAVRGYGIINRTGTIQMDGKVIADGHGVDRTLNLTSFTSIQKDITNAAAGGSNGWYAVDHGRLSLPLQPSPGSNTFTWGDDPNAAKLDLVNSVRLTFTGNESATDPISCLSLLSPDRSDIPDLIGIDGAPVGLWQVDPADGSIASADLTVRYNDTLITQLGATESEVSLWTLCTATDTWSEASTFSLDTADHIVTGDATDFSYFAVAVPPASGQDVGFIIAHPQAEVSNVVPEPVSLIWISAAGALLARRRRKNGDC